MAGTAQACHPWPLHGKGGLCVNPTFLPRGSLTAQEQPLTSVEGMVTARRPYPTLSS